MLVDSGQRKIRKDMDTKDTRMEPWTKLRNANQLRVSSKNRRQMNSMPPSKHFSLDDCHVCSQDGKREEGVRWGSKDAKGEIRNRTGFETHKETDGTETHTPLGCYHQGL